MFADVYVATVLHGIRVMSNIFAFYGIRVHAIIARLLRGIDTQKLKNKYEICQGDFEKIKLGLDELISHFKLSDARVECKLSSYKINGRCDAIFFNGNTNRDIIIDWKFLKRKRVSNIKYTTRCQLNIYRALYMEIYNKDCDLAVVFINYYDNKFVFSLKPVEKMDKLFVWGLINFAKQKL